MAAVIAFLLLAVAAASAGDNYRNCWQLRQRPNYFDGIYVIYPYDGHDKDKRVEVWCDMTTDGGGWTVIQRRGDYNIQENFNRTWGDYVAGFGDISTDHWLGLDHIHALTHQETNVIRFYLADFEGQDRFAEYKKFYVGNSTASYRLEVNSYGGTAGDSFTYHNGRSFSTWDDDHDTWLDVNCAKLLGGGWWYGSCSYANLNNLYLRGYHWDAYTGVDWFAWHGDDYSLKDTVMMIRPAS